MPIAVHRRYTSPMAHSHAVKILLLAVAGWAFATTALAQWQWTEKDGRKVFSDRPPPSEVADKDISRRPSDSLKTSAQGTTGVVGAVAAKPAMAASATAIRAASPKLSGKDAELEAKKKQAEEQEAAKKKSEEEAAAKVRADNCERAKTAMATLQSGARVATVNASGEREIFDDAKRAAETRRTQEVVASNCK